MAKMINPPDLNEADNLLKTLLNDVQRAEGTLAGGEARRIGKAEAAVSSLFKTEVRFGTPKDKLRRLTEEIFQESGAELTPMFKRQMQEQYDFYYMAVPVIMKPEPGVQFVQLACELDFGPKGSDEPIIQTIFPTDKWRDVMNFGVGMNVGLDGSLSWNIGVDSTNLPEVLKRFSGDLQAKIANKDEFKAFIAIPEYKYQLGRSEITALGESSPTCYWYIQDPELQKMTSMEFATVFKVPKGTESITLKGIAWAEPNMNWLTMNVEHVFRRLTDNLKNLLTHDGKAIPDLSRGVEETWTLTLPKPITAS
ncbi:hypothetical protein NDI44_06850 [Trichocoleus sp. DQ-A3]|uniref:hypothetical protein n=1 Tax=Cyanophyceae TaxID=3028117 RepID=UPI001685C6FD|nr:hypothetical protein [Coleofasciculus sp. FACHB-125]MBD1898902.1 hypothetical protein [Coleofasciculus sp. FACHB-125]